MVLDVRRLWTLAGLCLVVRTKVSDWDRCLMIPMHTAQTTKAGHLPSSLRTCCYVYTGLHPLKDKHLFPLGHQQLESRHSSRIVVDGFPQAHRSDSS